MNKHCYRIVFNAARGIWMAVAESADQQGKSKGADQTNGAASQRAALRTALHTTSRPLALALMTTLGLGHLLDVPASMSGSA